MKQLILLIYALALAIQAKAQDQSTPAPIIFIYDASGSMWGKMESKTKMEIARDVLSDAVNQLPEGQNIGLVAYGHRQKGDCKDVEYLVGMENESKKQISEALAGIKPLGKTPLAFSASQVIDTLRSTKQKATIILLTDGIESCDGDICEVVKAAKAEGIDFRMHIIGFGLKPGETEQLICAAEAGDGKYYDAGDAIVLGEVLQEATTAPVGEPEGNFSVYAIKNGAAIDAYIAAYEAGASSSIKAVRTYGDTTVFYLPPGNYTLKVKPLEGSDVNTIEIPNVQSFADSLVHQTIPFDGGKIKLMTKNNDENWDAVVSIFDKSSGKKAAGGRTYGKWDEYELNPGIYDVQLKAMIIEGLENSYKIENVIVKAGETTELNHTFKSGIAMIGATSSTGLVDAVVAVKDSKTGKSIASGRTYTSEKSNPDKYVLSPGTYQVTVKALGEHKGKTETFTLEIVEGATIEKIISF